jgi:membrane associated rhomboid family serine protease
VNNDSYLSFIENNSYVSVSMGASGAVYGLLFFCIIDNTLQIFTVKDYRDRFIPLLVIPYFILSIFFDVDYSGRTDHAAHIGGAVMGILIAMYLCEMPEFIKIRIPNAEKIIKLIALSLILSYFIITLLIFYFLTPVNLK